MRFKKEWGILTLFLSLGIVLVYGFARPEGENFPKTDAKALWPNAKLAAITVMYKVKGYNPEANDWYWVKYLPDGSVDKMNGMALAGKPPGCINCHASDSGAENDYLIGYNLSKGQPTQQ